MFRRET
jgi:hypothetical protein